MKNGFGAWLAQQRAQARIGLRQFAHLTGYSPTYVSRVENGHERPSRKFVEEIALSSGAGLECREIDPYLEAEMLPDVMESALLNDRELFSKVYTLCLESQRRRGAKA